MRTKKQTLTRTIKADFSIQRESIEKVVDEVIKDRLKTIVEERLGDFVHGEFAKLRLTGKPGLMVDEKLRKFIDRTAKHRIHSTIDREVRHNILVADIPTRVSKSIDRKLTDEMRKSARHVLRQIAQR